MPELIRDGDMPGGVLYSKGSRALYTTNLASQDLPKPSELVLESLQSQDVAFWGTANDFPQQVLCDVEKSDIIPTVLDWKARTLVGEGVAYGNMEPGPGGSLILAPMQVPEIERWFSRTSFDLFCEEAALDYYHYYNANAELEKARNGQFVGVYSKDQSWRRYGVNNSSGLIDKAYESACWSTATDVKDRKKVISLPAIDPYMVESQMIEAQPGRMVLPLRIQTGGRKYYALAPWNGLRASGWFALAIAIPKMKLRLIENLMQAQYQIEIADTYWTGKYKDWKDLGDKEKRQKYADEVKAFEDLMFSEDEVGKPKTLMTQMVWNQVKGEMYSLWKITPLRMETPTGAYVEDGQEADFHIVRSLGVDPALVGISPGKNATSAGSGSADRVKLTNYKLSVRPHSNHLLRMMPPIAENNGWNKDFNQGKPLVFMFRSLHTATLDRTSMVSGDPAENIKETDAAV
jgi:hypothetical protein